MTLRQYLKKKFDDVVYTQPGLNRILRNLNKLVAPFTRFRLRPFGVLTVTLKSGSSFRIQTNETNYATKFIFWNGADQFEYTPVFEKLVKSCSTFLDIGANLGYYSILAGSVNPNCLGFAFEPAAGPYKFLKENLELNNLTQRISAHKIALSDKPGEIIFYELSGSIDNLGGTGSSVETEQLKANAVPVTVPADTLDHFMKKCPLPSVDLIKIDTEGTEPSILLGAAQTIRLFKPIIICETLFQVNESTLESIMKDHGYLFFNHIGGKLVLVDTLERENDNGVRDCFFVHPDKYNLIQPFL